MLRFTWTDSEPSRSTVLESYCSAPLCPPSITHPLNHNEPANTGNNLAFMASPGNSDTVIQIRAGRPACSGQKPIRRALHIGFQPAMEIVSAVHPLKGENENVALVAGFSSDCPDCRDSRLRRYRRDGCWYRENPVLRLLDRLAGRHDFRPAGDIVPRYLLQTHRLPGRIRLKAIIP